MNPCNRNTSKVRKREQMSGFTKTGAFVNFHHDLLIDVNATSRLSGLWGPETLLDIYLQQTGIDTLFFGGVNTDQACGTPCINFVITLTRRS
jgi:nicotinamidase-related amidase